MTQQTYTPPSSQDALMGNVGVSLFGANTPAGKRVRMRVKRTEVRQQMTMPTKQNPTPEPVFWPSGEPKWMIVAYVDVLWSSGPEQPGDAGRVFISGHLWTMTQRACAAAGLPGLVDGCIYDVTFERQDPSNNAKLYGPVVIEPPAPAAVNMAALTPQAPASVPPAAPASPAPAQSWENAAPAVPAPQAPPAPAVPAAPAPVAAPIPQVPSAPPGVAQAFWDMLTPEQRDQYLASIG